MRVKEAVHDDEIESHKIASPLLWSRNAVKQSRRRLRRERERARASELVRTTTVVSPYSSVIQVIF